jgi:hypothetical protein
MMRDKSFPALLREKVEQFRRHELEYLNPVYKEQANPVAVVGSGHRTKCRGVIGDE